MTARIVREAACACGQLRLRIEGEPRIVRPAIVLTVSGAPARCCDSGAWIAFRFCPRCGSTAFWENERLPEVVSIAVGAFADPQFPAPVRTVWIRSRHHWLEFPPDMPGHPENPASFVPR